MKSSRFLSEISERDVDALGLSDHDEYKDRYPRSEGSYVRDAPEILKTIDNLKEK